MGERGLEFEFGFEECHTGIIAKRGWRERRPRTEERRVVAPRGHRAGVHEPHARKSRAVPVEMTAASALTVEIEERSLHCVTRRANTARKKKPGHFGRDDR